LIVKKEVEMSALGERLPGRQRTHQEEPATGSGVKGRVAGSVQFLGPSDLSRCYGYVLSRYDKTE
jgi:hypothetical protein